jgi:methionyl-tRNA formyltransferase
MLDELLTIPEITLCGIITRRQSAVNADHVDLSGAAEHHGIPVLFGEDVSRPEMADWIISHSADVGFCLGWSYLLDQAMLSATRLGIIGYHPALLPRNRGRHPIIWALALGLEETGSTFFFMDVGADSGPILSQVRVAISPDDDAGTLYARLVATACGQLRPIVRALYSGTASAMPQDDTLATNWRKRSRVDGLIDWRMPATGIHNLVRALAPPYPGARAVIRGTEVAIWRTRLGAPAPRDVEPGFVLDVDGPEIRVQTGLGTIILVKHELAQALGVPVARGDYL